MQGRKPRIIVLGGGLGALSAVYWLTEAWPRWRDEYDITVYQMGWRLGGKGASGRNHERCQRIEEHGFHVWFGFYENAFRMMDGLFAALKRRPSTYRTFGSVEEAFTRRSVWTFEQHIPGAARHWPVLFPVNDAVPGKGREDFRKAVLQNALGWLRRGRRIFIQREDATAVARATALVLRGAGLAATMLGVTATRATEALAALATQVPHHPSRRRFLPQLVRRSIDTVWDGLSAEEDDEEAERIRLMLDLVGTLIVGILQDRLWEPLWQPPPPRLWRYAMGLARRGRGGAYPPCFESVDDEELREWLDRHGAHSETVESSLLRQVYDIPFAYADGNPDCPDLAAGTTARGLLRFLFGYKRACMYEMRAGMGDTIFTPLYAVLEQRGVDFKFFHRVEALRLDQTRTRVAEIEFDRQLRLRNEPYDPLVRVGDLDCWPSEPKREYLHPDDLRNLQSHVDAGGHVRELESSVTGWRGSIETLEVGAGDWVILGLPVAVLPQTCEELLAVSERWRGMVERVPAIPTYAIQLWLRQTSAELGWRPGSQEAWKQLREWDDEERRRGRPSLGLEAVLCGYDRDLNAYADMSHLIPREAWGACPEDA